MTKTVRPSISVDVNLDKFLFEFIEILQFTKEEIENVTRIVNEQVDANVKGTVKDVVHIVQNVRIITDNMANTTGIFYQPIFIVLILLIFVLILLIILIWCVLKTRREYKKNPMKLPSKYRRNKNSVEPQPPRRSTSVLTAAEEGQADPYPSEKKRNDTLV